MSIPRHIAIIMDGNGRWAQQRGLPRYEGHRRGGETVRTITEACAELGIGQLTLYCLSSENWKRPKAELDFLMVLLKRYLIEERPTLQKNDIRLAIIGNRDKLPDDVLEEMDRSVELCRNHTGLTLCLAINYGSRQEIVTATRRIVRKSLETVLRTSPENGLFPDQVDNLVDQVDEEHFAAHLDTAGMPEPDLLIRTAGEMRLSNYLLWQLSYAEIWVTETLWPDFNTTLLEKAIADFSRRTRRFGGLSFDAQDATTRPR